MHDKKSKPLPKREKDMFCDFCGGRLFPKTTEIELKRGDRWVIIEGVPAEVCSHCGEKYFSSEVAKKIDLILKGNPPVEKTITVPVVKWDAVVELEET